MALTARLALDIRAFEAGLEKATDKLDVFAQKTVKNTSRDLSRLLEDFTGQKVVAEAARMSEAVERIGGASKLTEAEQQRVNAAVTQAIAKYRALGQEAPAHLVALQRETAKAEQNSSALVGTVGRMAAAFSVASLIDRGASAVFAFGAKALESAGHLVDLRDATQVSLGTLQQWTHVGKLAGVELDTITTNAFKASAAIAKGDSSVQQGVRRLNLEWEHLRGLAPEQQMAAILSAADALGPSQQRNSALVEIFGQKAAVELAKVATGYRDAAAEADVAADAQVEALDKAGEAWDRLTGKIGSNVLIAGGTLAQWVLDSKANFDLLSADMSKFTDTQRRMIDELRNSGGEGLDAYLQQIARARQTDIALTAESAAAQSSYVAALGAVKAELAQLTPATKAELDAAILLHGATEKTATAFGLSEAALRLYRTESATAARESEKLSKSISFIDGEIDPLTRLMIDGTVPALGQFVTQTGNADSALEELRVEIARLNGDLVRIQPILTNTFKPDFAVPFKAAVQQSGAETRTFFDKWKDGMGEAGLGASGLSNLFAQAFTGGGGALGAVKAFATQGLSTLLGMIPGVGQWAQAFAGPIVAMLSKLSAKFKALFGGPSAGELEGRELVADFEAELAGSLTAAQRAEAGTDAWKQTVIALRDAYIAAGRSEEEALADAKKLWESSKKGAAESAKVIAEIKDKLDDLPEDTELKIKVRYETEGEPPAGGVPNVTPSVGGAVAAGTSARVNALPSAASAGGTITVPVYLDGFQIAMATAPHRLAANRRWGV